MTKEEFYAKRSSVQKGESEIDLLNEYAWAICRINTQEAYEISLEALEKSEFHQYPIGRANSHRTIGNSYLLFGDYTNSVIHIENSLNLFKELCDRNGEAESLNLYGIVYSLMGKYELAITNFEISLDIMKELNNTVGIVKAMNSIGDSLIRLKKYKRALKLFEQTIKIEHDNEIYKGIVLYNISEVYYHLDQLDQAEKYLNTCEEIGTKLNFELMHVYCCWLNGKIFIKRKQYEQAAIILKKALASAYNIKAKDRVFNILEELAKLYELKGDYKLSLGYFKEYLVTKEEVINEESAKVIKTIEHKNEVALLKREAEVEKIKNLELKKAYSEIADNRNEISKKNKEITDSIRYAKRIQEAILPSDNYIKEILPESFIIYQPKDILSGDFYWMSKVRNNLNEDLIVVAVADCTGHGVPGALLSIVGNNFLRLCEAEATVNTPAEALDFLNKGLCDTLRQNPEESTIKDGMDISFLSLNQKDMKLYYAGAKSSLYLVRANTIIEVKGDKHPIGSFLGEKLKPFTNHEIKLDKNDQIYLFTDGYVDQFGGEFGKKYKLINFKKMLLSIHHLPMDEQKRIIRQSFQHWKGGLEQVDDVCVFSIRIS